MALEQKISKDAALVTNRESTFTELVRVRAVKPLDGYKVHVTFSDNSERDIDLEQYLRGPIFEPLRTDLKMFASVYVDPEGQTLAWPNGADIDPDTLYYDGNPPWAETEAEHRNVV